MKLFTTILDINRKRYLDRFTGMTYLFIWDGRSDKSFPIQPDRIKEKRVSRKKSHHSVQPFVTMYAHCVIIFAVISLEVRENVIFITLQSRCFDTVSPCLKRRSLTAVYVHDYNIYVLVKDRKKKKKNDNSNINNYT